MGAMQNNGKQGKARGVSKAAKNALAAFGKPTVDGAVADWGAASSERVMGVVQKIAARGGAVLFGSSRDGGSLLVTLYLDGDRVNVWIPGSADVDEELWLIEQKLEV